MENNEFCGEKMGKLFIDKSFFVLIQKSFDSVGDAQSERQTSIYSPPFYSSPTGYKMRGRLYLNGDGNARRTHMSLFFVLMRSEYDAVLKFPFNYKVTFCLYDQSPAQRHIIDSFQPDIKSNSFQRPRSEMNIASGIPKFFPLAMIQQEGNPYVKDDTIFIKIMVDFGDMPKTLLPYAIRFESRITSKYSADVDQTGIRTPCSNKLPLQHPVDGSSASPSLSETKKYMNIIIIYTCISRASIYKKKRIQKY